MNTRILIAATLASAMFISFSGSAFADTHAPKPAHPTALHNQHQIPVKVVVKTPQKPGKAHKAPPAPVKHMTKKKAHKPLLVKHTPKKKLVKARFSKKDNHHHAKPAPAKR